MHDLDLAELYVAAYLIGAGETVVAAASRASIPLIVHAEKVPAANGNVIGAQTFGLGFAGPALGGFVFSISPRLTIPSRREATLLVRRVGGAAAKGDPGLRNESSAHALSGHASSLTSRAGLRATSSRPRCLRLMAALVG